MILCNLEIQRALDEKRLFIDPEPLPRQPDLARSCPYGTHSVDLTLSPKLIIPKPGPYSYDLEQPGSLAEFVADNSTQVSLEERGTYLLEPQRFILAMTRETVGLL